MTRSAPMGKDSAIRRQASALTRAWWHDRSEFKDLVEAALTEGDGAVLTALLATTKPNHVDAMELEVCLAAETLALAPGRWARLFAMPAIVNTDDGGFPDTDAMVAAFLDSGLLAADAGVVIIPDYLDADAVKAMGWCERRLLLTSMFDALDVPRPLRADLSVEGERGTNVLLVGAVVLAEADEIPLVDHILDSRDIRELLVALLRTGSGLVDVSPPLPVFSLGTHHAEPGLVERTGAVAEIRDFFAHASEMAPGGRIDCEMRPVDTAAGDIVSLRLVSSTGETVDAMEVDPYELPMSPSELRRLAEACSERFRLLPPVAVPDMGFQMSPPPRGVPALHVVTGGRDKREEEDRDAWVSGVRKKMADLRKSVGNLD